jgi:hypothetical protein
MMVEKERRFSQYICFAGQIHEVQHNRHPILLLVFNTTVKYKKAFAIKWKMPNRQKCNLPKLNHQCSGVAWDLRL